MINPMLKQKKLTYYITYVKNLIASLSEEYQSEEVHHRRITPILDRLLSTENDKFLDFFDGDKSKPYQLLQLMHLQGEIFQGKKGYYSLFPERVVQFPYEDTSVLISGYDNQTSEGYYGLAQPYYSISKNYPKLKLDDYAYRPEISNILPTIEKKLAPLTIEITELYRYINGSHSLATTLSSVIEGEWFIIVHETPFKRKDLYVATRRDNQIYAAYIEKYNYRRIVYALYDFYDVERNYIVKSLKNGLLEISFNRLLPLEEKSLLNLIALPNCYFKPQIYVTTEKQLGNIQAVTERLKLKELR